LVRTYLNPLSANVVHVRHDYNTVFSRCCAQANSSK